MSSSKRLQRDRATPMVGVILQQSLSYDLHVTELLKQFVAAVKDSPMINRTRFLLA